MLGEYLKGLLPYEIVRTKKIVYGRVFNDDNRAYA